MTSIEDWEQLRDEFVEHFGADSEVGEEKLRYEKAGEFLEIRKDGSVEAGMPLHENRIEDVKEVKFQDSEIKVESENSNYVFRR